MEFDAAALPPIVTEGDPLNVGPEEFVDTVRGSRNP
jgi:hypothetical protein